MHPLDSLYELYFAHKLSTPDTIRLHRYGLEIFAAFLGRPPTLADFSDDVVARWQQWLLVERRMAESTVEGHVKKLLAFWRFLRDRGDVARGPLVRVVVPEETVPVAWLADELRQLYRTLQTLSGAVCGIPLNDFWIGAHDVMWDTSERAGAVWRLRWDWIHWPTGIVSIPGRSRKGRKRPATYELHELTLARLDRIRQPERELVFPVPYHGWAYYRYEKILRQAGLPADRAHKFHCMRRSVLSHFEAAGEDSTRLAGHSSPELTRRRYHDPRIVRPSQPANVLFRPDGDGPRAA